MRIRRLGRRMTGALRDERGGILVTAALSMLPITLMAFAAVEFHNFTRHRTQLQDALDAAALAVARAPTSSTQAQLRTIYVAVLKSHLTLQPGLVELVEAEPDPVTGAGGQPALTYANGQVVANATLSISPIVANLIMNGNLKISGGSTVLREAKGLEVALVLDNTGSMETNNRIGIAKTAATNFVNALEQATVGTTAPGSVKIGLVPFSATVNVGSSHYAAGATWLDRNAASPIAGEIFTNAAGQPHTPVPNRFTLLSTLGYSWGGCVESRPHPYDVQDTAPSAGTPATLFVPYFAPDTPDVVLNGGLYATNNNKWDNRPLQSFDLAAYPGFDNHYVRDIRNAVRDHSKSGNDAWLGAPWGNFFVNLASNQDSARVSAFYTYATMHNFPLYRPLTWHGKYTAAAKEPGIAASFGPNQGCDTQPVTRLTSNYTTLRTAISNMTTGGATNIPMGLVWGWHLLSPNAPFSDGAAYGTPRVTKVAVLMTDGDNAIHGFDYTGIGYSFQNRLGTTSEDMSALGAALNTRMATLCTNMRNAGIVVYTVRVEVTGGDPEPMRNCATSPEMFFDVKNASDLDSTFKKIAQSIQNLRIAA